MNAARFALALTLCAFLALPARAATLTVTSAADDGTSGTLRSVLASASAGDTITFALAPRATITLTQGTLYVSKQLHIVGPHGGGIAIAARHVSGIFAISGGTASKPVTLSNLHLRNGYSSQGAINNRGSLILTNCTLADSRAGEGGGLFNDTGTLSLVNCTFRDNHAIYAGGGLFNQFGTVSLTNCAFTGNRADLRNSYNLGGALANFGGFVTLHRCTFSHNEAQDGGCIHNDFMSNQTGRVTAVNCTFTQNEAIYSGGCVYNNDAVSSFTNCIFTGNRAGTTGGAFYNDNGYVSDTITLTNDILYNDTAPDGNEIYSDSSTALTTYCDIQGGFAGNGNFDADPQFVSNTVPFDLRLTAGSPCIDAGTANGAPPFDRAGNLRDASPDIGAFEFQP